MPQQTFNPMKRIKDQFKVLGFEFAKQTRRRGVLATDLPSKPIGIVGLGAVGLTLGVTLANLGFKVCGFDINPEVKKSLREGRPHFFEIGLNELFNQHLGRNFHVIDDFLRENNCDIYFINVGTPLDDEKRSMIDYILDAAEHIGSVLKRGDLVVLRSTVPIGTTRAKIIPVLERASGLSAGEFFVAFSPERTVEGKALVDIRVLPQVVGGFDEASTQAAAGIFKYVTSKVVVVESLESAEMVKLVNNTYRDLVFNFANEIALIARKWGLSGRKVIEAANEGYHRSSVPMPSPGVGGYCLPKDSFILQESARSLGHNPILFQHARRVSDKVVETVAEDIHNFLSKNHSLDGKVFVVGFAYKGKPPTSDTRGSTTYDLVRFLQERRIENIYGYDHLVPRDEIARANVSYVDNFPEGVKNACAVVVMTNNSHFETLPMSAHLEQSAKPVLLYDTWHLYPRENFSHLAHVHHLTL